MFGYFIRRQIAWIFIIVGLLLMILSVLNGFLMLNRGITLFGTVVESYALPTSQWTSYTTDTKDIIFNVEMADLEIVKGDSFSISYPENYFTIVDELGTLSIFQSEEQISPYRNSGSFLSDTDNLSFKVTLPKDFDAILSLNGSMMNVKLADISGERLWIDIDMGNVELEDCHFIEELAVNVNMGNTELEEVSAPLIKADAAMGNIEFSGFDFSGYTIIKEGTTQFVANQGDEEIYLSVNMGVVQVDR